MSDTPIVYIIEDDEMLRRALDGLFRSIGLKSAVYGCAQEFLDAGRSDPVSCLVMDVRLPGLSGLDFQETLAKNSNSIPVILMTGHGDIPMSVRAMKAGAIDFLAKPFRDQDMLDAVSSALARARQNHENDSDLRAIKLRFDMLSLRERQVMTLVTQGLMNKQVAGELSLSEVTVKIHRGAAMRKMQARSLADLVRMAEHLKLGEA